MPQVPDNIPALHIIAIESQEHIRISRNDQIFLVICGHSWNPTDANGISQGENMRMDDNLYSHPVYQVLSDYQGNTTGITGVAESEPGGEGWLRLMTFDMKAKTIHFKTYSPLLNRYAGLQDESTFGQPAAFSDFVIQMPIQVLNASWAKPASNDRTEYHQVWSAAPFCLSRSENTKP
jgi:hypothetical protein